MRGSAFSPATSLRVFDLSESLIHKLPDSIGQLKQLRYLNAPGIQDRMVPECITNLSNLIYLNLHGSSIVTLPKSIGKLESLVHLDLSNCFGMQQLPVSFRNIEKLAHLDLSNCYNISGVSESLGRLSRLEHLDLKYCRNIGDITGKLGCLKELQYLNLSRFPVLRSKEDDILKNGLPQVLVNLTKLRYLSLQNCLDKAGRDTLLECISNLCYLEHLDLSRNINLYRIPESFRNLKRLHTLNISYCTTLERLPASLAEIDSLKHLDVSDCWSLNKSTLPQYRKSLNLLPNFVVHAADGEPSSNLCHLEYENPNFLDIFRLENVKSEEEAQRIKLVKKNKMQKINLVWTKDAKRYVEDTKVLEQLVPPDTVEIFILQGYNSVRFPQWMMDIAAYLPYVVDITLIDLPNCNKLPPLGQLGNLKRLLIMRMDKISKIDRDFYGGAGAFPQLETLTLEHMEGLEDWNTAYSCCENVLDEIVLPKLQDLYIMYCPKLRFKSVWPLRNKHILWVRASDKVIVSSLGGSGYLCASTNFAAITWLYVECCEAPLHHWSLLRHLPNLKDLHIKECSDLTCSSEEILKGLSSLRTLAVENCKSIVALPERLGDLTSLELLYVADCKGIKALPDSIQQLTGLRRLNINGCPELVRWCKSGDNKMKLTHIKEIGLR